MTAFAFRKPVIATDVGGFKDVVNNGVTGLLIPPRNSSALANAIESLVFNEKMLLEMGKNIEQFENSDPTFSWPKIVHKMLNAYESIN